MARVERARAVELRIESLVSRCVDSANERIHLAARRAVVDPGGIEVALLVERARLFPQSRPVGVARDEVRRIAALHDLLNAGFELVGVPRGAGNILFAGRVDASASGPDREAQRQWNESSH